jgi:hypothetical protein
MTERRRMYDDAHLNDAIKRYIDGEKIKAVQIATKIPYSTLKKYVSKHRKGDIMIEKKKQEESHTSIKNVKIPLSIGLSECKE